MREFIKPLAILCSAVLGIWLLLFSVIPEDSNLLWFCLLAFTLGLRHGLDADHIAAIDNITRKMVADGKNQYSIGIYFALGHSSVVFLMTLLIVMGVLSFQGNETLHQMGALIGSSVSILFLLLTALINALIFSRVYRHQNSHNHATGGILTHLFRRVFDVVTRPRAMYGVGFLFGLGFDTATEITILGMAATQAINGVALYYILLLPIAFASGMCLTDALDSWMQLGLCKWSNHSAKTRRRYNLFITAFSVLIATTIALSEMVNLLNEKALLATLFNNYSEWLGVAIITLFGGSWLLMRLLDYHLSSA